MQSVKVVSHTHGRGSVSAEFTLITPPTHILSALMATVLPRTRKPTADTRCMCPLYDTNRQAWIKLQPMSIARISHGVVAAGQCRARAKKLMQHDANE